MNISFAWTIDALLTGSKTVTRRDWTDSYAKRFPKGSVHTASDRALYNGGRRLAKIEIISIHREPLDFFKEPSYAARELKAEGGLWKSVDEFLALFKDAKSCSPYRVEFKVVGILAPRPSPANGAPARGE
jgi:hypothetical protein